MNRIIISSFPTNTHTQLQHTRNTYKHTHIHAPQHHENHSLKLKTVRATRTFIAPPARPFLIRALPKRSSIEITGVRACAIDVIRQRTHASDTPANNHRRRASMCVAGAFGVCRFFFYSLSSVCWLLRRRLRRRRPKNLINCQII